MNTEPDAGGSRRNKFGKTRSVNTSLEKMFTAKNLHGQRLASNSACRKYKEISPTTASKTGKRSGFLKAKEFTVAHKNWESPEVGRGRKLSHPQIADKTKAKSEIRAQLVSIFEKARTNFNH
jgi:hypothetical protein